MHTVVITDHGFDHVDAERTALSAAGAELVVAQCTTAEDVIRAGRDADALLVQWAPVSASVLESLRRCRLIVRYGIGYDNVDVEAANRLGIAVANVPDYCIDEVADHSVSLALSLARQLPAVDARVRSGTWRIVPDSPMPAFREMTLGTLGFGRVAQAVHRRVDAFGFSRVAADPFASRETAAAAGVALVDFEELIRESDILSLHAPLTPSTRGVFGGEVLAQMKRGAILVNTSRGGLVDVEALAEQLTSGHIGGAGLDVFDEEPLPVTHAIRSAPRTILTSHMAWFSGASVPRLQSLAAMEVVRGLRGEPLLNPVGNVRRVTV
jgi:D-3-phosphoglycerate dehydrogenase